VTQPDPVPTPVPGAPQGEPTPESKTFTQDEVNRFLAEEKRKAQGRFGDYDELKAKAAKLAEYEAQNATELEKAMKKAADEARADVTGKTNTRLVRAEVKAAAAALGFHNPAVAATQLADKFAAIKVDDTGDVDEVAVKALVEQLAKDEPYLVKTGTGRPQPLPGQGQHQTPSPAGQERGRAEARRRFGDKPA
jgi:hypothetical protein